MTGISEVRHTISLYFSSFPCMHRFRRKSLHLNEKRKYKGKKGFQDEISMESPPLFLLFKKHRISLSTVFPKSFFVLLSYICVMNLIFIFHSLGFSLSLFFGLLFHCAIGRQMKFNVILYRHGDRSPLSNFPKNTVKDDVWPRGYGQLTKTGIQQAYNLGKWLKDRYNNFLSPSYNPKEIYVQSTDYDRTIMTAEGVLAGLFPPTAKEAWNPDIHWQPIPVHTVPLSEEKLLIYPNFKCPSFNGLLQQFKHEIKFKNKLKKYMVLIRRLAYNLGYDKQKLLDFQNLLLWKAYDTLKVQEIHKHSLPKWADKRTMQQVKSLLEYLLNAAFGGPLKNEKSKLQGGILVKHILETMINSTNFNKGLKMIMYSAHDMTIIALQTALGVSNQLLIPYAATHIFELYEEDNGSYTIEMYYRNNTAVEPHMLTLPGCSKACPLEKFQNLVTPILPTKEC